jgi:hypothetical protein
MTPTQIASESHVMVLSLRGRSDKFSRCGTVPNPIPIRRLFDAEEAETPIFGDNRQFRFPGAIPRGGIAVRQVACCRRSASSGPAGPAPRADGAILVLPALC